MLWLGPRIEDYFFIESIPEPWMIGAHHEENSENSGLEIALDNEIVCSELNVSHNMHIFVK